MPTDDRVELGRIIITRYLNADDDVSVNVEYEPVTVYDALAMLRFAEHSIIQDTMARYPTEDE